jgi:microcystin-dependent protein
MSVADWSTTASRNTTVDSISIAEGCPPGNVNDAIRAVMANIRALFSDFWLGLLGLGDAASLRSALDVPSNADVASAILGASTTGMIGHFARSTPPGGWLEANGAAVSRTEYAALFAAIGVTWGGGDGSTTFNLPDLRGEFVRGWDNGRGVDAGRPFANVQGHAFGSHDHALTNYRSVNAEAIRNSIGAEISSVGGGGIIYTALSGGTETRPRNVALLVCIKT